MTAVEGGVGVAVLASVLVLGLAATSGVASAGHNPEAANYTVTPLEDRSPGAENVEYGLTVVGTAGVDLETLTKTLGIYEAGSWSDCGPTSASVFGIDRGDTHDGYETDEPLTNNVKSFSAGEDRLETEYNGEDDIGASTHFYDGDQFVVVADCIDNPDRPGWYQITGTTTGVTADGETVTYGGESHYFWICNCRNEAAAREQLGPPPSEPATTPTPISTTTATTANDNTVEPADSGAGTRTDARTDREGTPTAAPAGEPNTRTVAPGTAPVVTARLTTADTPSWAAVVYGTPTQNDGAGFGSLVAIVSLTVSALLLHRRR